MTHPTKAICPILLVRLETSFNILHGCQNIFIHTVTNFHLNVSSNGHCVCQSTHDDIILYKGGLQEDYCGEERRAEFLHLSNDKRLYEESCYGQPPSGSEGIDPTAIMSHGKGVWSLQVDSDLEIKAYYAGHVLGAAMFQVKVHHQSIVYTVSFSHNIVLFRALATLFEKG